MEYIGKHRKEFEAEYEQVVKDAEENRKYWEKRDKGRLGEIGEIEPPLGKEKLSGFVRGWEAELGMV